MFTQLQFLVEGISQHVHCVYSPDTLHTTRGH